MAKIKPHIWQLHDWEAQIIRITSFTNIARVTIFFTLLVFSALSYQFAEFFPSGSLNTPPALSYLKSNGLHIWLMVYGVMVALGVFYPSWQKQKQAEMPNLSAVADITMMVLLTHLFGGTASGFGILILPFIAISCLLSYGRYAMLYAGYASLLLLFCALFREWPPHFGSDADHHRYWSIITGNILLITGCFLVSLLTSYSASFLSRAGESVRRHRTAFERISALNKVVLNRTQEAVVVIDTEQRVWMHNRPSLRYFADIQAHVQAPLFREVVRRWRGNSKIPFETNIIINGDDMNVRAVPVIQEETELLILFIRAEKERVAEAQSVKLASLGLLTANLAHEIRNPLSAVRQANGLMIENAEDDPMTAKLCGIIDKNIARIDKMIEEVSSLNKSDKIKKENIVLKDFWLQFFQEFLLTVPKAAHCVNVSIVKNTEVMFDPMHLQQILWNLCNNAWRHSSQNKKSAITITAFPANEDQISLRVFDDGGGVPDDIINHLFEPFFTTQVQAGGTGLGLYVARELAHANKGDLRYLPEKKAFELILPRARYE
ncbi:MAG: HAMP domain-containing sensor histidine kinase [Conchiformibius sp.]|nr:HAMP domain-containing sensor histidine kinase [Conchiformibius sp.]